MVRLLTIFNIIAGGASIIGVMIQLLNPSERWPAEILLPVCLIAGILSLYVLFVPDSKIERNVRSKIERYSDNIDVEKDGNILIQRGTIRFIGFGERTVEFDEPFLDKPNVEILDSYGDFRLDGGLPKIKKVSPHILLLERNGGAVFARPKLRWIARGKPLQRKQLCYGDSGLSSE